MNCLQGNNYLWILIILLILCSCTNVFRSGALSGCGWPMLVAAVYCLGKNGTLDDIIGKFKCGCGCD